MTDAKSNDHIGVVIVNWNGWQTTLETLESLWSAQVPQDQINVYLVDNGSTDSSVTHLSTVQNTVLIPLGENRGFAGGSNRGIEQALSDGCRYVLLLNNDVYVHPDFLVLLVQWLDNHPSAGIVTPKIRYAEPDHLLWYGGGTLPWPRLIGGMTGIGEIDAGQYDRPSVVGFATACCILVRREVFEQIGFLDERFYFYQEDVDFCIRAAQAGFEVWYCPASLIWHRVSYSTSQNLPLRTYYYARSRFIFFAKHIRGWQWVPVIFLEGVRCVRMVIKYGLAQRPSEATAYLAGLFSGMKQGLMNPLRDRVKTVSRMAASTKDRLAGNE